MKLKLDENLGCAIQEVFEQSGHDVASVVAEHLSGADDQTVFDACRREQRCLVTLDLDFADRIRFRSLDCGGIVVLRMPQRSTPALLRSLALQTVAAFARMPMAGDLWIVEPGRMRIHQREDA